MANLSERAMADELGLKKTTVRGYKEAGMPMHDAEAARDWIRKSVNVRKADTRPRASAGTRARATKAEKLAMADISANVSELSKESKDGHTGASECGIPPAESADFDAAMMKADAELVLEARSEVQRAMKSGNAGAFNFALGNYSKLANQLVAARLRWMESAEKAGKPSDDGMVLVGIE